MIIGLCDRCDGAATRTVTCYYGCEHRQCDRCATQTESERVAADVADALLVPGAPVLTPPNLFRVEPS